MNTDIPTFALVDDDLKLPEAKEITADTLPQDPEKRREHFEKLIEHAHLVYQYDVSAKLIAGLILLKIEQEKLHKTKLIVPAEGGPERSMTVAEYYTFLAGLGGGGGMSPTTLWRARKCANQWLYLKKNGVNVEFARAHLLPLLSLDISLTPGIMKAVIETTHGKYTEEDVAKAVCEFQGVQFKAKESAIARLKRQVTEALPLLEGAVELGEKSKAKTQIEEIRKLVDKPGNGKKKTKKQKTGGGSTKTDVPHLPAPGSGEDNTGNGAEPPPNAPPEPPPPGNQPQPSSGVEDQPGNPAERTYGNTRLFLEGREVSAFHDPFDAKNPPASDSVLRSSGLLFRDARLRKVLNSAQQAEKLFNSLCVEVPKSLGIV